VFVYFSNVASKLREEGAPGRPEERLGVRYNLGLMRRLKFSRVLAPYDASVISEIPRASSTKLGLCETSDTPRRNLARPDQ
jgi:hypothetical protein